MPATFPGLRGQRRRGAPASATLPKSLTLSKCGPSFKALLQPRRRAARLLGAASRCGQASTVLAAVQDAPRRLPPAPSAARLVLYACHLSWPPWATPPWRSSVGYFAQIPHSLQVRAELQGAPAAP